MTPEVTFVEKDITGTDALTFTHVTCVEIFEPTAFVAVRLMDQFPIPKTVVMGVVVPSENQVLFPGVRFFAPHVRDVGVLVLVSVSITANGAAPLVVLVVKDATGGVGVRYRITTIPEPPDPL